MNSIHTTPILLLLCVYIGISLSALFFYGPGAETNSIILSAFIGGFTAFTFAYVLNLLRE